MIPFERRQQILRILQQQPGVRVSELARRLDVTEATVRSDLRALEQEQRVKRVHGGAVVINGATMLTDAQEVAADWIVREAARMIEEGDSILLDAGALTLRLARRLHNRRLTVATYSLDVAQVLAAQGGHTVLLLGGVLRADGRATLAGTQPPADFHVRHAFVTGAGWTAEDGLMDESDEARWKEILLPLVEQVVVLLESTQVGQHSAAVSVPPARIHRILTDANVAPEQLGQLQRSPTQVSICSASGVTDLATASATSRYTIGFANLSEDIPFAVDVRRSLEQAVARHPELALIVADNQLSQTQALENAEHFIAAGVDLFIEYQIDALIGTAIMNRCQRAGVPVIAVDIPMVGATYFGVDNFYSGHLAGSALGQWIQRHWGGALDRLLILEEPRAGALPQARIEGQLRGLEEVIGAVPPARQVRLNSGNTYAASAAATAEALDSLPADRRIAVICFNDDAALGALHAAQQLDREQHVAIVGQGADRLIREELRHPGTRIVGSTAFMPERYGEKLVDLALRILRGEPAPPAVYIDHVFIDPNNVDAYVAARQE
ncbi:MAG TPA: substrate-binding domain-containing protein [Chloroflexi bacterium]|nr:substrate-binding domain-containing protein [Chloroflexota bacterium]